MTSHPKRGVPLYCAVLSSVRESPKTHAQISEHCGLNIASTRAVMAAMVRSGMAHVSAWQAPPKGTRVPVFSFGPGSEAPHPLGRTFRPACRQAVYNFSVFKAAWEAVELPASCQEVAEQIGCSKGRAFKALREMRAAKLIRISGYVPRVGLGGEPTQLYLRGSEPDARRPRRKTSSALCREYGERSKTVESGAKRLAANVQFFKGVA